MRSPDLGSSEGGEVGDAAADADAPTEAIPVTESDPDSESSPATERNPDTESTVATELTTGADTGRGLGSWGARQWVPVISFLIGTITVTTLFTIGVWQRRWIADDGLIVLRTLRNLFAGNGPVFNVGERVEANTSTAWTYVLWFWAWVTDGQLEYVALWVALVLSVAAIPIAMYATARLYRTRLGGLTGDGWTLLLPFGVIAYVALPPARDFATSGLENGLCIFWVAVLWGQLVAWSRRPVTDPSRWQRAATLTLAFTAGLAPLIRPELTILGGLVLLLVILAPTSWPMRIGMIVVAAVLPVGYQIFRMGYYALLVPNPAVAKDASGAKWHQGLLYLANLFGPYVLLLPVVLIVVTGIFIVGGRRLAGGRPTPEPGESVRLTWRQRVASWSAALHSPSAATVTVMLAGLIGGIYWIRQGGDFMHGRVLLVPLFTLLLPLMVVPVTIPAHVRAAWRSDSGTDTDVRRRTRVQLAGSVIMGAFWVTIVAWAAVCSHNVLPNAGTDIGRSGIVDERRFYVTNMGNENPVTAEDYLDYPRMGAMAEWIERYHDEGGVILPSFNYDEWYIAKLPGNIAPEDRKLTVYFLNLGMTSMNAPLDVRVIDQMGLAYPLAAHTERLEDGRIGHDKVLPSEWVVAEAGAYPRKPVLPGYLDEDLVRQAQVALRCPETQDRFDSYEAAWTWERFKRNLKESFTFTDYRIEREPEYEIARCGLQMPPRIHPR